MEIRVNLYEIKTNFSKYINLLQSKEAEAIVVLKNGKETARITLIKDLDKVRVGAGKSVSKALDFTLKDDGYGIGGLFGY